MGVGDTVDTREGGRVGLLGPNGVGTKHVLANIYYTNSYLQP